MKHPSGLLSRLRSRGEELLTQLSAELGSNPRFVNAMAGAMRGKERLEQAVARVLRQMSVPTRGELQRALARIDALEREVGLRKRAQAKSSGGRAQRARQRRGAAAPAASRAGAKPRAGKPAAAATRDRRSRRAGVKSKRQGEEPEAGGEAAL